MSFLQRCLSDREDSRKMSCSICAFSDPVRSYYCLYNSHSFQSTCTITHTLSVFDAARVDLGMPMFVSCMTGMSACTIAAAAHILGKENVPVYYVCTRTCVLNLTSKLVDITLV